MGKVFFIRETKRATYTYRVIAKSKADALNKFRNESDYEEVGMSFSGGDAILEIDDNGVASDTCAECGKEYSPDSVSDYRCKRCKNR